ncbi:MAG: glycosyl hydrolase family 17 protein [Myxococcota bacterium]
MRQSPDALLAGVTKAVAYSGYRAGQYPDRGESGESSPTPEQIREDLTLIEQAGFGLVRLYDSGAFSKEVLRIIAHDRRPVRVLLGAWLDAEMSNHEGCPWLHEPIPEEALRAGRSHNLAEVDRTIALANAYPTIVVAVNIGNEALVSWNDHMVPLDHMMEHIERVRQAIAQPVSTADNYVVWAEQAHTLAALDFAMVHTYPQWEGKSVDEAMAFTLDNLRVVREALPDVPIVIGEAGWATEASEFGERATEAHQARYCGELLAWAAEANVTTMLFEAFDEPWKGDPGNPAGAEKHWGLFDVERRPKALLAG